MWKKYGLYTYIHTIIYTRLCGLLSVFYPNAAFLKYLSSSISPPPRKRDKTFVASPLLCEISSAFLSPSLPPSHPRRAHGPSPYCNICTFPCWKKPRYVINYINKLRSPVISLTRNVYPFLFMHPFLSCFFERMQCFMIVLVTCDEALVDTKDRTTWRANDWSCDSFHKLLLYFVIVYITCPHTQVKGKSSSNPPNRCNTRTCLENVSNVLL